MITATAIIYKSELELFATRWRFTSLSGGRFSSMTEEATALYLLDNTTDFGLCNAARSLPKIGHLSTVYVQSKRISDVGIKCLVSHSIERLTIVSTGISDDSMTAISRSATIQTIRLDMVSITNKGIGHLDQLRSLKELQLYSIDIDDDVVDDIANIESLQIVGITGPTVTPAAISRLRQLRPDLIVGYSPY